MLIPYTSQPGDAFVVAQSSLAAVLTAVAWWRPLRPLFASGSVIVGIWLAAWVPVELDTVRAFGYTPAPHAWQQILGLSAAFMAVGLVVARPRWIALLGLVGWLALHGLADRLTQSNDELSALHLVWFGTLFGLSLRFRDDAPSVAAPSPINQARRTLDDAVLFLAGVTLAGLVSTFVLQRSCDSADEWAYTFQASLFSHGRAYQAVPQCSHAVDAPWVVYTMGRAFSEFTPGWSFFMAPFWRLGAVWLAGPVAFGLLLVAVARIARRVASGAPCATSRDIQVAGILAASTLALGACTLFNAGSRYSHVFVAATFAWMVEGQCSMVEARGGSEKWFWGAVLGSATALCLATRPADGAMLGFGVLLCFVHALTGGSVDRRGLAGMVVGFSVWALLTLTVLRLQLGGWFRTGASAAEQAYPGASFTLRLPTPDDWARALPLATGAYCFWPCAPALGILGLVGARGAPKPILVMLGLGTVGLCALYASIAHGRDADSGYGPRLIFPALVAIAIGSGAVLARLFHSASALYSTGSAFTAAAPAVLATAALVAGTARLIPLMYPYAHDALWKSSALVRAIQRANVHHAVVTIASGQGYVGPLMAMQNDPNDADVIVVGAQDPADIACARRAYADRVFLRAVGQGEVSLTPY